MASSALLGQPVSKSDVEKGSPILADPVMVATVWVEKAQVGSVQWTSTCTEEQLQAYCLRRKLKPLTTLVKYSLLLLAVIEVPSYCVADVSSCPRGHPEMHASRMPQLPPRVSNAIALAFFIYLAWYQRLRHLSLGPAYACGAWHKAGAIFLVVAIADCIVALINTHGGILWFTSFRVSRVMRPLVFLCFTHSLRAEAGRVLRSLPKYADVFLSLGLSVLFFSWIGLILFMESEVGPKYFGTWGSAVVSLFDLFTLNDFDPFLKSYEINRLHFLYFASFFIITMYLLCNVLLASVYEAYKEVLKDMVLQHARNSATAMEKAFELLADERGSISPTCWVRFFTHLCNPTLSGGGLEFSDNAEYNKQRASMVFQALDKDHNQGLDMGEFKLVLDVLHNSQEYIPRKPPPPASKTGMVAALKKVFLNGIYLGDRKLISWEALMDVVIVMDVSIVFFQTLLFVNGGSAFNTKVLDTHHPWYWLLFVFSLFYVTTVSLKLMVLGIERFWYTNPVQHRFDFFTVYLCFAVEMGCFCLDMLSSGAPVFWLRFAVLLHITRILRVIHYLHPLRHLATVVVRLSATYFRMGMLLVLVYYVFATVGQQIFGGLIYSTNPALEGSMLADAGYWSMNFNDFNSGMVTLFLFQVMPNWTLISSGFIRGTGNKWPSLFFFCFYLTVNLVVLNILIALIIDCSGTVKEELSKQEKELPDSSSIQVMDYEMTLRQLLLDEEEQQEERVPRRTIASATYGSTDSSTMQRSVSA